MVYRQDVKKFLSKINPFVEKIPEITAKLSELEKDKGFQDALGKLGTVGGLFSIGLYIFNKALENSPNSENTCFSLINKTALHVAKEIIKEAEELMENEHKNEELLKQLLKIYTFKKTDLETYQKWNGIPIDHPIVQDFRKRMFQIIKENNIETIYPNFVTEFNIKFQDKIQELDEFKDCQKQTKLKNLSKERAEYLRWILNDFDKPHPIDKKKVTEYYIQNRAIEFDLEDEESFEKDYWNISDFEAEKYFTSKKRWCLEDFLSSRETIKFIAAPFGTGKTSFAKYMVMRIAEENLTGQNTWIPLYIPLKQKLNSIYTPDDTIYHDLSNDIRPQNEKILLVCDGLDEYPNPDDILSLKNSLLEIQSKFSISKLKIIFTTRLEAGLPQILGIKRYVRLLPFTPNQVTEFFRKYDLKDITFKEIRKYRLQEKDGSSYKIDLLKPLFCWMFALSYSHLQITKDMGVGMPRLILYSTFIHSILEGRYHYSKSIANEKWILRKIAALKSIFEEVYEENFQKILSILLKKNNKD